MSGWGRARVAFIVLGAVAILFLFVFPTRSYIAQRNDVNAAKHDVEVLRKQNDQLEAAARKLQTKAEIERAARQQFNMVYPGETVYKVMPKPAETTTTTVP
jgi:cell division protein FtsB